MAAKAVDRTSVATLGVIPAPLAVGLAMGGLAVLVSTLTGLILDDADNRGPVALMLLVGLASLGLAAVSWRFQRQGRVTSVMAMSMLVAAWFGVTIVGHAAFFVSGEFASFVDGMFEAVSATTTTGFTTIPDPQELTHTTRLLRVLLPWSTGFGVLIAGMGVLPVAVAGVELAPFRPLTGGRQLVTSASASLRRIVGMYMLLTGSLVVGYLIAGMSPFDAASYAFSTASTGGMANHADSIGAFDSLAVDLVATLGMIAAGGNLLVVWWAFRREWKPVWHSTELRLYLSLLTLGFLAIWASDSELSALDGAFAASSMLSTTGFRGANWAGGAPLTEALLLVAAGIGAMSGSVGSGFRLARAARVALEVRRGLWVLLNPNRVGVVRMDGVGVSERSLSLTYGYLWMHLLTLAVVAATLNPRGFDVVGTLSFTVGLVSNVGVYVDGGQISSHVALSGWTENVAAFGMLLGRLSIYPVIVTISGLGRAIFRLRPRAAYELAN
ncbi:MAG: potassium transporter TrkG [Acidimicrobiales bacterium]